jgi:hypothetical protein
MQAAMQHVTWLQIQKNANSPSGKNTCQNANLAFSKKKCKSILNA